MPNTDWICLWRYHTKHNNIQHNDTHKKVSLKGKDQYSLPPCTNRFRPAPFYIENILNLFHKTSSLNEVVNCTEPYPLVSNPWHSARGHSEWWHSARNFKMLTVRTRALNSECHYTDCHFCRGSCILSADNTRYSDAEYCYCRVMQISPFCWVSFFWVSKLSS